MGPRTIDHERFIVETANGSKTGGLSARQRFMFSEPSWEPKSGDDELISLLKQSFFPALKDRLLKGAATGDAVAKKALAEEPKTLEEYRTTLFRWYLRKMFHVKQTHPDVVSARQTILSKVSKDPLLAARVGPPGSPTRLAPTVEWLGKKLKMMRECGNPECKSVPGRPLSCVE